MTATSRTLSLLEYTTNYTSFRKCPPNARVIAYLGRCFRAGVVLGSKSSRSDLKTSHSIEATSWVVRLAPRCDLEGTGYDESANDDNYNASRRKMQPR
jgi:hypothetical protein